MEKKLRIGFLGVGEIAVHHARAVEDIGHHVYAGACRTSSSDRWLRFLKIFPSARLLEATQILSNDQVDCIIACLPWNETHAWLSRLLAARKPVLIEKPVALSSESLERALEEAAAPVDDKFVGYNRRFYESTEAIQLRLAQGGLKSVTMEIPENVKDFVQAYGTEIVRHTLAFYSCHVLDLAQYLLGRLRPVSMYRYPGMYGSEVYYSYTGILETDNGVPVTFSINDNLSANMAMSFRFDDGTNWVLSPIEVLTVYEGFVKGPDFPFKPLEIRKVVSDASLKPGFKAQMLAFLSGGTNVSARVSQSVQLLRLIEDIKGASEGIR